jgi:hypothetical protein
MKISPTLSLRVGRIDPGLVNLGGIGNGLDCINGCHSLGFSIHPGLVDLGRIRNCFISIYMFISRILASSSRSEPDSNATRTQAWDDGSSCGDSQERSEQISKLHCFLWVTGRSRGEFRFRTLEPTGSGLEIKKPS